jgi:TRAP-type C4-dicarboxylate transport system permease large subunit
MQHNPSVTIANRSLSEWVSSLPTLIILLIVIFLSSGEIIHSQLLKIGENTWDEYFLLRGAGAVQKPTCDPDPNIQEAVDKAVREKKAQMEADPLAGIFGTDVDRDAVRQSVIGARDICRDKWERFETIQQRITPEVKAFRAVETTVAGIVTLLGNYKRLLLCLLVIICAATATVQRHHISLRPMRTKKDHLVGTIAMLSANSLLLTSSLVYREEELQSMAEGVTVSHFYLHWFWILGFGLLTAISLYQLFNQPKDAEEGGSWGKAILTVPLYSFMCLSASIQFMTQGYYHGISVYLGMMMELSTLFLNLALYIWIGMMLKQTRLANLVFDIFRPWNMSPELLCFVVLVVAAVPTAYTGASGIFVIAAGAVIYNELRRAGSNRQLALAATAMSGSMGVVLRPCLLVVIIAALNKSVTTTELFSSGLKIFALSALLFFFYSQMWRQHPARIAPFNEALPASIRKLVPILPYVIIIAGVVVFFSDVLDRALDEFSAPIILPVFLLFILVFEKFSHKLADLFAAGLGLLVIFSFVDIWPVISGSVPADSDAAQAAEGLPLRNILLGGLVALYPFFRREALDQPAAAEAAVHPEDISPKLEGSLRFATNETTGHIGALLMLMALSVSLGGLIERGGLMESLPEQFANVWVAMSILVVVMVIIGMIMDPYGAVILVNATIAQVAFDNGIAPLHFWMLTLVAFELGYLTPPVALNHLLTRQVVGDDETEAAKLSHGSFWRRYEKFLLPIATMLTALLMVAYLPLIFDGLHDWVFQKIDVG